MEKESGKRPLATYFIELYDFPSLPIKSFANLLWAAHKSQIPQQRQKKRRGDEGGGVKTT